MAVPNTFASATSSIPLANLDANFAYYDAGFSLSGSAVTFAGSITLTTGTANGVPYLNASKVLTSGAVLTFDGTTLSSTKFAGALNGTVGATTPTTGAFTTLSATGITTLSAATTPLLLSGAGSSSTTLPSNYAIRINAGLTAANYGGIFFDGSTVYDSFFGRVPTALSGVNDGIGYVTYASGTPTLRTLFTSTGLAVTGTLSATGAVTLSGGTANGVAYLDASKVLTTGTTLTFDGTVVNNTGVAPEFRSTVTGGASYTKLGTDGIYATGTDLYLLAPVSKFMAFYTNNAEKMRLDSSGNLTVSTGNVVIGTAGKGIDFSATSSGTGTMTSELLADYEEGTWTPSIGGTATYAIQEGKYTKIGRQVTIQGIIEISAIGTGSATTISGLPFTVSGVTTMAVGYFANLNSSVVFISGRVDNATTNIVFSTLAAAATGATLGGSVIAGATRIDFSGSYFV